MKSRTLARELALLMLGQVNDRGPAATAAGAAGPATQAGAAAAAGGAAAAGTAAGLGPPPKPRPPQRPQEQQQAPPLQPRDPPAKSRQPQRQQDQQQVPPQQPHGPPAAVGSGSAQAQAAPPPAAAAKQRGPFLADRTPMPPTTAPSRWLVDAESPSCAEQAQEAGDSPAHAEMDRCTSGFAQVHAFPCVPVDQPSVAQPA